MSTAVSSGMSKPRRAMSFIWLLTVAVIYYGSLYPFELRALENPGQAIAYLLGTTGEWDKPGDLVSNILLYIPCGLFGMLALKERLPASVAIVVATLAGTALSCSVEFLQYYAEYRNPTCGDIYANAIGSAAGAMAGLLASRHFQPAWLVPLVQHPRASLLLALWLGARLYPYVPTIDLHKYWRALKPLVLAPELPPTEVLRYLIAWLFIAALMHACYGAKRWALVFAIFATGFFAAKVLITNLVIKPADLIGCLCAGLLWLTFLARVHARYLLLSLPYLGLLLFILLTPFSFSEVALRDYGWVPFKSLMHGSIGVNVQSFCEKSALYGGMIWLLARGGFSLAVATLLTAGLLFACSYMQIFLPGRSAEITDVLIGLLMGIVFVCLPREAAPNRHE
ncbi:MAG: VanZ family protein [Rhodocyclaceae bacterium]|nr:VanZ family protein [Rhodocyclaceae bacterium]